MLDSGCNTSPAAMLNAKLAGVCSGIASSPLVDQNMGDR
jgi:hypothetical protein